MTVAKRSRQVSMTGASGARQVSTPRSAEPSNPRPAVCSGESGPHMGSAEPSNPRQRRERRVRSSTTGVSGQSESSTTEPSGQSDLDSRRPGAAVKSATTGSPERSNRPQRRERAAGKVLDHRSGGAVSPPPPDGTPNDRRERLDRSSTTERAGDVFLDHRSCGATVSTPARAARRSLDRPERRRPCPQTGAERLDRIIQHRSIGSTASSTTGATRLGRISNRSKRLDRIFDHRGARRDDPPPPGGRRGLDRRGAWRRASVSGWRRGLGPARAQARREAPGGHRLGGGWRGELGDFDGGESNLGRNGRQRH